MASQHFFQSAGQPAPALAARGFVFAFIAVTAIACGASDRAPIGPTDGGFVQTNPILADGGTNLETQTCSKMDILFIVDNSGSMAEEQANLAGNFKVVPQKLDAFKTNGGSALDYRVAITTTGRTVHYTIAPESPFPNLPSPPPMPQDDKGDDGRFRKQCNMTRPWLERSDPDLTNQFSCAANVGTAGPGLEMPLESIRLALTDRMTDGSNAGFLRDDALLAIVVLTDEDDCSRKDSDFTIKDDTCNPTAGYAEVSDYVAAIDAVKGGRDRWAAAIIAGPTNCKSGFGDAREATRLKEFVAKTGTNAVFSSICAGDLVTPLQNALNVFDAACKGFKVK